MNTLAEISNVSPKRTRKIVEEIVAFDGIAPVKDFKQENMNVIKEDF